MVLLGSDVQGSRRRNMEEVGGSWSDEGEVVGDVQLLWSLSGWEPDDRPALLVPSYFFL